MIRFLLIMMLALCPLAAAAQDDGTVLSRFLEDQLSDGDDRQVTITGFRGALSSEATLERMEISDADGVWLVLEDAVLDWTRSALLTGELQINALTAARLEVLRPPLPADGVDLSDTEAQPFSLPDLPVRVDIGTISVAEVVLGAPLIGLPATLSVDGRLLLANGTGEADITLDRLDGPTGQFTLDAAYDNATRQLDLALLLQEAEGGLAAELLGLPGRPDVRLAIEGSGPIDGFTADIALATGGQDRILGQVISSVGDTGDQLVTVDIGGDVSPLLLPDYRAFFGDDVQLQAQVRQSAEGGTELEALRLTSTALTLEGNLALAPNGLPSQVSLVGQITPPEGDTVRLPAGGVNAQIARAGLAIIYDRDEGDAYRLRLDLDQLSVDDLTITDTALDLQGALAITDTGIEAATADLTGALTGVSHRDPAFAQALGTQIDLSAMMSWVNGAPMILSDLTLATGEVALTGGASAQTGEGRLDVVLELAAQAGDLGRFGLLAGQPLDGAVDLSLTGTAEPLSGAFDLAISGQGRDLRLADAVPAELFAGETLLSAQVTRDETGLTLQDLSLENAELSLAADASLSSGDTSATTRFQLQNVGLFTDLLSGPVTIAADVTRTGTAPSDVVANLTGPNAIRADIDGVFDAETTDFTLALDASAQGLNLGNGIPPQLLAGRTTLSAIAVREGEVLTLSDLSVANPELTVTGDVSIGPQASRADIAARLTNVGLFTDALTGPVRADGTITRNGDDPWQISADLGGPGGMGAAVNGRVGLPDGSVDLTATGSAPLALANRYIAPRSIRGTANFNLAMQGQPGLAALSGTLNTTNTRVSVPTYALAVENVGVNGQLSGGRLSINANGRISSGGGISANGSINLANPGLDAQLAIGLRDARLVDPTLYEARISSADLTISGPLARGPQVSGTVNLGESEIRVPEASLYGSAAIPEIRYVGETREQRLTRQFAGLLATGSNGGASGSATTGLDITINAPGRIFLRGRGIDAEFGGTLRLFGTTANMIPTGQFNLLRGRLSILGTRLDFTEGSATLQGSFDPFLRLAATSRASGYEITIGVVGAASSPEITFSSSPALPEDEVLAQLLFGRSVSGLSPLQLLQMADAATSLAGGSTNSGFIAGLRDGLGLDDLDLSTDDEGNAAVTAGRYLSDNIYTDVTINAEGDADLSLNIDLTPNITARGSVGSDGGSSIGIFFEQDY
ncbi:translocation/assembly module TamB domain-containing protein [Rhodobacteraceae bacterium N5(2021)]|uniref:Translocation/assembly module TamB domain-containing protein n=1 Tax=Gymnodinialimonas phycosphaerae TaxID=2841589 RepID=A0A975TTM6_9RHOB|nr:translocation/assembly module TamB domain-containing protein [Gymnodinialimonas phycosphaerae]MBY4894300.1 translocation/assembly module TamB domain-containing protein [Gymnodinialimonas phycosphaerae]